MPENSTCHPITIDLNEFKLHIALKNRIQLTIHFNSPSRRFYLSVIALVVIEMKKRGKLAPIPLEGHRDLLALLNETIGGSAGSSETKTLLSRIYKKWQHALPDLEEAPLFMVLGRKKGYEEGTAKSYHFTEAEKDSWANLFEYRGSHENARLKFAVDKIGASLDDIGILYEDSLNGDAWGRFISSLTGGEGERQEPEPGHRVSEEPQAAAPALKRTGTIVPSRHRWVALAAATVVVLGTIALAIWQIFLKPAPVGVASIERMAFPLPDKPSIAVLPFANMGGDPEQEYFSDGMTEDLITDLSRISGLFVIARSSTLAYKGKPLKVRQVAEELGVRYVMEGSVRRVGDQVRINAQLIDAITGHHLWAERFDGSMKDIFALQDAINQKIVGALAVKLTPEQKAAVREKGTDNVAAYDEFVKGREHFYRHTSEDYAKAEAFYKRAIELDPKYGQAGAWLAELYWYAANIGLHDSLNLSWPEARLLARQYLREAMKEPNARAYVLTGHMNAFMRQHDEAISDLEKALALDPNDPGVIGFMSWVLGVSGRPAEGMVHIKAAMRLDPQNPGVRTFTLGFAHFCMGQSEEAATVFEKAHKLSPRFGSSALMLASTFAQLGRDEEARATYETYRKIMMNSPVPSLQWIMYYFPFKDRRVADSFAEGLIKAGLPGSLSDYIHVSKEDQLTGNDLKTFLYPSTVTGLNPNGSQWSLEFAKDGTTTLRSPGLPGGVDTGRSWLEGDTVCFQYQKFAFGKVTCGATFRNPRGTSERKNEYVRFTDLGMTLFSKME
jgi:adenylate cyclase